MNYSQVLEITCPFPEVCAAAGLPPDSKFGDILVALINKLSQGGGQNVVIGFKYNGKTEATWIAEAIDAERASMCEACAERIKLMMGKLREDGWIPEKEAPGERAKARCEAVAACRAN